MCMCVCMCARACVREGERDRGGEKEGGRESECNGDEGGISLFPLQVPGFLSHIKDPLLSVFCYLVLNYRFCYLILLHRQKNDLGA